MGIQLTPGFSAKSHGTLIAVAVAVVCFVAGTALTAHVAHLARNEVVAHHKSQAVAGLSEARASLEAEINRTVANGLALKSYIAQFEDEAFDLDDYSAAAMELIADTPSIRSVGLAPDNIVQAVFPTAPNRSAIGLDYRLNTAQWPAIREAMTLREVVIAGPLELVQGGTAFLVRIPVFPAAFPGQPLGERSYWGVVTLVLDQAGMMAAAGLRDLVDGYRVGIVDRQSGTMIFGSAGLLDRDHVTLPLYLPGGLDWQMIGLPDGGWISNGSKVWVTQVSGSLMSLVFSLMAFLLINEIYKVRAMALHDPLTGLANRRLLEDRMLQLAAMCERTGAGFEIFYVDLDAFKPVNDNYGHAVGDRLLIEVGDRLRDEVRQSDTVARVGGDEFIVLTPGSMRRQEMDAFLQRLEKRVAHVFEYAGVRIDVKASIGSASYPGDAASVDDLLRIADGRMYVRKARTKQHPADVPEAGFPHTGYTKAH